MPRYLSQAIVKRLAILSASVTLGANPNLADLEAVPEQAISELLDDSVLDDMEDVDRRALFRLLGSHPHARVRMRVARRLAYRIQELTPQAEAALSQLAVDPSAAVRGAAHRSFYELLRSHGGVECLRLVCQWSLAPEPYRRLAVAHALRWGIDTPVADTAALLLRGDPDPEVRRVAQDSQRG